LEIAYLEQPNEKISTYKKIRLYGSQQELIVIVYDFIYGATAKVTSCFLLLEIKIKQLKVKLYAKEK
jgi:hypothetical protein